MQVTSMMRQRALLQSCASRGTQRRLATRHLAPVMQQQQQQQWQARHYRPLPNPPADPLPWKEYTTREQNLHTVVYNPMGKSMKPPMPLLILPGLNQTHHAFSSIVSQMNYPYGVVAMDMRGRGKSNNSVAMQSALSSEEMKERPCGDLFQHVKDVIHVMNEYHMYRAIMIGSDFGAMVAYWVAKLYPDRCNGLVMLNSGFAQDGFSSETEQMLRGEIDTVARKQHDSAQACFHALTGMTDTSLDTLPLNDQERFKYEFSNRADADLLERDLAAMKSNLDTFETMFKIRHPVLSVRSEFGVTPDTPALVSRQAASDFDQLMNVKDSYFAKGATHHSMLFGGEHSKAIAEKIDEFAGRYDIHRVIEKDFEELRVFDE